MIRLVRAEEFETVRPQEKTEMSAVASPLPLPLLGFHFHRRLMHVQALVQRPANRSGHSACPSGIASGDQELEPVHPDTELREIGATRRHSRAVLRIL